MRCLALGLVLACACGDNVGGSCPGATPTVGGRAWANLRTSRNNGGAGGTGCGAGEVCVAGSCSLSCQAGLTNVNGRCTDLMCDRSTCGTAGNACPSGQVCSQ